MYKRQHSQGWTGSNVTINMYVGYDLNGNSNTEEWARDYVPDATFNVQLTQQGYYEYAEVRSGSRWLGWSEWEAEATFGYGGTLNGTGITPANNIGQMIGKAALVLDKFQNITTDDAVEILYKTGNTTGPAPWGAGCWSYCPVYDVTEFRTINLKRALSPIGNLR